MWKIVALVIAVGAAIGAGALWGQAGQAPGPVVTFLEPTEVGQIGTLDLTIDAPGGVLTSVSVTLEQQGTAYPLFSLDAAGAPLERESADRLRLTRPLGQQSLPQLKTGPATLKVNAARPVLFGFREAASTTTREIAVRLDPPTIAVQSLHHFVNHGGSEVVVYRVSPASAVSRVRVGEHEYPSFPARGAGIDTGDPGLRVAFFALLWDQDLRTPISIVARDALGNEGAGTFDYRVNAKQFRQSNIQLDDAFLARVVPAILQNSTELVVEDPSDLLGSYLRINRDLRRSNNETIAALAAQSAPEILWRGPFKQLVNTAVEAGFADQRTYVYKGEDVDRQVHLGFDLASTAAAAVLPANRGRVLHAGWLGIYGNCVILDHGMGLQSLYAHLSSIDVQAGDFVEADTRLGRSGATGLAGGDHLHFTMLLGGKAVTPIDWWSPQWVQDRIVRKLVEAGAPAERVSPTP